MARSAEFFSQRYQEFLQVPSLSDGNILPDGSIELMYSNSALTEGRNIPVIQVFQASPSAPEIFCPVGFPTPRPEEIKVRKFSPSRKYLALVRKQTSDASNDTIEIWSQHRLLSIIHCKNCPKDQTPEPICTDEYFGGLQWSPNEEFLTFTSVRDIQLNTAPFYDIGRDDSKRYGEKYSFEESWGDSKENLFTTSLWVAKVFENERVQVQRIQTIPDDLMVAQPIWTPNGNGIIFVGQKRYERRLGHIYCTNRASALYCLKIDPKNLFSNESASLKLLTENVEEDFGARFPSFSPNGKYLVYITSCSALAHSCCERLRMINWNQETNEKIGENNTIVEKVVQAKDFFQGLYCRETYQTNNWQNQQTVILETKDKGNVKLLQVNVVDKSFKFLKLDEFGEGSYSLLDCFEGKILGSFETPIDPPSVFLCGESTTLASLPLSKPISNYLENQTWKFVNTTCSKDEKSEFESLLISPKAEGIYPLIAYPHGGPHSWTGSKFISLFSYFVSLGYHILLVNYRGSLGYGESALESLFGKCGFQDVQDVMDAINNVSSFSNVDENRIIAAGGSHGGFLTGHLLGQFPDKFKAGVMRNPVTNIASMVSGSDIPDWCELCACGTPTENGFPGEDGVWQGIGRKEAGCWLTEEKLMAMYKASPIAHVSHVKAPTIIILGKSDKRVPNYQGKEFYYQLKSRNIPCKIFAYEQPHAITKVDLSYDAWINISLFLEEHAQ